MAGLVKLHRSVDVCNERQLWAVHVGRGEIVWQDRCDAANGSKEPNVTDAALQTNVGLGGTARTPIKFHAFIRFLEPVRSPHVLRNWTGLLRRQRYPKLPLAKPMTHR